MSSRNKSLNVKYLEYLKKYPLLTKSVTAAVLAVLNETIATTISKDFRISRVLNQKIKHPFSIKIPLMALFAFAINAPVSHYGFLFLNKLFKGPLSKRDKILQILTMLMTVTPIQCSLIVSFISLINMRPPIQSLSTDEIKRTLSSVKTSLKASLLNVLKSSWVTTPIVLTIAQNYIHPDMWAVFTNIVYFFLGTGQNTFLKIQAKRNLEYTKKRAEVEKEVEREVDEKNEEASNIAAEVEDQVADALEEMKPEDVQ